MRDIQKIDRFGPENAMIASNLPPNALAKRIGRIYEASCQLTASFSKHECHKLFSNTVAGVYGL